MIITLNDVLTETYKEYFAMLGVNYAIKTIDKANRATADHTVLLIDEFFDMFAKTKAQFSNGAGGEAPLIVNLK